MKITDIPSKQTTPFGINGARSEILTTTPSGDNTASYDSGFPPITMLLKSAGGKPPKGKNMNQILYELSNSARWIAAGGGYPFDASFAAAVGGYPKGCVLKSSDLAGDWINNVDQNLVGPEGTAASDTGWSPANFTDTTSVTGLTGGTFTLSCLQAARGVIRLTGALTSDLTLIFPAWVKQWRIENFTTGSKNVYCKTLSGTLTATTTGVMISEIYCNGTNILFTQPSSVQQALSVGTGGYILPNGMKNFFGFVSVPILAANYDPATGSYESAITTITPTFSDNNGTFSFTNVRSVVLTASDISGVGQMERAWMAQAAISGGSFSIYAACRTPNISMTVFWQAVGY